MPPINPSGYPISMWNTLSPKKSVLFPTPQSSQPKRVPPSMSFPPRPGMGYFAFPPQGNTASTSLVDPETLKYQEEERHRREREAEEDRLKQEEELSWQAEQEEQERRRAKVRNLMAEEARRGEEEWVRSGGVLRDALGARDYARTEAIREELRLRDVEKRLMDRWESYEQKWNQLTKGTGAHSGAKDLRFADIPWPVDVEGSKQPSIGLVDLTVERVEEFLLGTLRVRGSKVTKKERVRASLLRWHPDKMTAVLARVTADDVSAVQRGINAVILALQQIQNTRV